MIKGFIKDSDSRIIPGLTFSRDLSIYVYKNLLDIEISLCFCDNISYGGSMIYEVIAEEKTATTEDEKGFTTSEVYIIKEMSKEEILKEANIGGGNTGLYNIGWSNTGSQNKGNRNSGNKNIGDRNVGSENIGDDNTGRENVGNDNYGSLNIGSFNTGNSNVGKDNAGEQNTGNSNLGDFNRCDFSVGCFCTKTPTMTFFDKPSNMTLEDWRNSKAYRALVRMPRQGTEWISSIKMSEEEKKENPRWEIKKGYLKKVRYDDAYRQKWWNELKETDKKAIKSIPNFDKDIFKEITGIDVEE